MDDDKNAGTLKGFSYYEYLMELRRRGVVRTCDMKPTSVMQHAIDTELIYAAENADDWAWQPR